ncbi:MAG: hypothetical protein FWE67_00360 [Planctomycetaceae bacterium]|nr:hypothetical protein [Planctomycetaceae bacterium]
MQTVQRYGSSSGGETDALYGQRFIEQWNFIKRFMIDAEHGGWFNTVSESGEHPPGKHTKANIWKTAYHETRALLNVSEGLKRPYSNSK